MYCEKKLKDLVESKDDLLNPDLISKYQTDQNPKGNVHKKGIYESEGDGIMLVNVDDIQSVPKDNIYTVVKWPLIDFVNIDLVSYGKIKCCNVYLVAATSHKISKGPIPGCRNSLEREQNSCVNKSVDCTGVESNDKTIMKGLCNEDNLMKKEISTIDKESNLMLKSSRSHMYHHALNFSEMRNRPLHQYGCKYGSTSLYNIKSITAPYSMENVKVDKIENKSIILLSLGDKVSEDSNNKGKCNREYLKEKPKSYKYQISCCEFKKTLNFSLHACSEINHNNIDNSINTKCTKSGTDNTTDLFEHFSMLRSFQVMNGGYDNVNTLCKLNIMKLYSVCFDLPIFYLIFYMLRFSIACICLYYFVS